MDSADASSARRGKWKMSENEVKCLHFEFLRTRKASLYLTIVDDEYPDMYIPTIGYESTTIVPVMR